VAIATKVTVPIEENAVGHRSVSADIADFVPLERVHCHNTERQAMVPAQHLNLFSNAIPDKVEHFRLRKIFGERPGFPLAGKISTAPIPQDYMNRVPLAHTILYPRFCSSATPDLAQRMRLLT
jgi:hypothetical protein